MNHKRKRPKINIRSNVSTMRSWPRWWDVIFHTRPKRRETKTRDVASGRRDFDDVAFPVPGHKPHRYYW